MPQIDEDIDVRSDELHDVLGDVPHWIIRRGILLFAVVVVLIAACCAVVKYPDTIRSEIILTTTHPTVGVVAKSSGKIKELIVCNNDEVKPGQFLAVIDNTASTSDVLLLKSYLQTYRHDEYNQLPKNDLILGSMQDSFHELFIRMKEYEEFSGLNYYPNKIVFLDEQVASYTERMVLMKSQMSIVFEQLRLAQSKFRRDSLLFCDRVLSQQEYETAFNQYLQSQLSYQNTKTSYDEARLRIAQTKEARYDTENQYAEKTNALTNSIEMKIRKLLVDVENWQMQYVLTSPIHGRITFTKYWSVNQNVETADEVFNIIPTEKAELVGKLLLPVSRSGKVHCGQQVNVRFENFPDNEYGKIKAQVSRISLVPMHDKEGIFYSVDVVFPNGLKTTYGKELPFMPMMKGDADVVTDDLTILERILMPLRKLWDNAVN